MSDRMEFNKFDDMQDMFRELSKYHKLGWNEAEDIRYMYPYYGL